MMLKLLLTVTIPVALFVGTQSTRSFFHSHQKFFPELYPEAQPRLSPACQVLPDLQR